MTKEKNINIEQTEFKELVGDVVEERLVKVFENEKKAKREKKKAIADEDGQKPTKFIEMKLRLLRPLRAKVEKIAINEDMSMNTVMNNMIDAYNPEELEKLRKKVERLEKQNKKLKGKA